MLARVSLRTCLAAAGLFIGSGLMPPASADLAVPDWYDQNATGTAPDWHYRIPITLSPTSPVNSTIRLDVNFNSALTQLGLSAGAVDFDERSPRVVRPDGTLCDVQEFTDRRYNDRLDPTNNARGEVQFILMDPPSAGTYMLYFDIVGNGAKPANPRPVINGHFEHSTGSSPTEWTTGAINANGDEDRRVIESDVGDRINLAAACSGRRQNNINNGPHDVGGVATGRSWLLLGYRDQCEDGFLGNERVFIERQITVPSTSAGEMSFWFQVQGYDGLNSSGTNFDYVQITVDGTPVNHTQLNITNPNPQLRILQQMFGRSGYSNRFLDHGWRRGRLNLASFAGRTITVQIASRHGNDNLYKAWVKLDDIAWSLEKAEAGTPEGFGVNVTRPLDTAGGAASTSVNINQVVAVQATVDAHPTRPTNPVTADVIDPAGAVRAAGVQLFNDGTHGDAAAGDAVWTNDGSDPGAATYTIGNGDPVGAGWLVRVFAADASVSTTGAANGLVHIPGTPTTPVDMSTYFNVDDQPFMVGSPDLLVLKQRTTIYDSTNETTNPKSIPGGHVRYTITVSNAGPGAVDTNTLVLNDPIPVQTSLCVSSVCAGGADPVAYDASASPTPTGLTFLYGSDVAYSTDGTDFTYSPMPDGDGFDSAVRFVRVNPKGSFNGATVAGDPRFDVHFVVRIE